MIRILLSVTLSLQMSAVALAQSHAPYAEMKDRTTKALSDQQIADLKAGRGMGLALPAELNGYPGPMHVLEHADALNLTGEQRERTRAFYQNMKAEAVPLGERLIENEALLEQLFANRAITPASLSSTTQDIARLQGQLRETHLKYHLAMVELLSPQQIQSYRQLRGYQQSSPSHQHHNGHRHHKGITDRAADDL